MVITGGGTGGHLFPAIATAQKLCDDFPESKVLFIGTVRKLDRESLSRHGYRIRAIHCYGLKGKTIAQTLKSLFFLPISLVEALIHLLRFRPQIVVGVGGYVTGPVLLAAKFLSIPTVIHEQNSIPGLANKKLATLVDRICYSIPGSETCFPEDKSVFTGNPVRKRIVELAGKKRDKDSSKTKTLLILGGSQGAHAVNQLVVSALTRHRDLFSQDIQVIHQTGIQDEKWVARDYARAQVTAEVAPFFSDMASIYSRADLLISRAGATTLAELAVLGKPAVLIPYPYAADDHQMKNAEYYIRKGGAILFRESKLTGKRLAASIEEIINEPGRLQEMGEAMAQMGVLDAPERIIGCCLSLLKT